MQSLLASGRFRWGFTALALLSVAVFVYFAILSAHGQALVNVFLALAMTGLVALRIMVAFTRY